MHVSVGATVRVDTLAGPWHTTDSVYHGEYGVVAYRLVGDNPMFDYGVMFTTGETAEFFAGELVEIVSAETEDDKAEFDYGFNSYHEVAESEGV
jgi:hypothetical protein